MYEGLASLARLDDAALVRNNAGILKKVFMEQLQDISMPRPAMQAAPMPPQMSPAVYRDQGGKIVNGDDYVIDAYTVAALGNGSSEAGGEVLNKVLPQKENSDKSYTGMVTAENGDGMSDNVNFNVENGGPIQAAKISKDEYIVDASQVAALGGGDIDKGTADLDKFREEVRQASYGTTKQPNEINGAKLASDIIKGLA